MTEVQTASWSPSQTEYSSKNKYMITEIPRILSIIGPSHCRDLAKVLNGETNNLSIKGLSEELTPAAVSSAVQQLKKKGLVQANGTVSLGSRGKPSTVWKLS